MPRYQNIGPKAFGYMDYAFGPNEIKSIPYFIDTTLYPEMLLLDAEDNLYNPVLASHTFDLTLGASDSFDVNIEETKAIRCQPVNYGSVYEIYLHSESNTPPLVVVAGVQQDLYLMHRRADKIFVKCVYGSGPIIITEFSALPIR